MLHFLGRFLFRDGHKPVIRGEYVFSALANIITVSSIIRNHRALQLCPVPTWAARDCRLLPSEWLDLRKHLDSGSRVAQRARTAPHSFITHGAIELTSSVYVLFNS
eukprot:9262240-Pyramimonas_sp.AAC.1